MKKFIMIFILLFAIFSCGDSDGNVKEDTSSRTEKTDVQTEKQKNSSESNNSIQGERYGNQTVGYVTKPENWLEFDDPNASPTAVQICLDIQNIVTLDVIPKENGVTAEKIARIIMQKYINEGVSKENMSLDAVIINGFDAINLTILMNDESLYSASYIDHNNKIYMLIQEGSADNRMELANVISSWNPDK